MLPVGIANNKMLLEIFLAAKRGALEGPDPRIRPKTMIKVLNVMRLTTETAYTSSSNNKTPRESYIRGSVYKRSNISNNRH